MSEGFARSLKKYLEPTFFIDSDHPEIKKYNQINLDHSLSLREKAVRLFLLVRDGWRYNPYHICLEKVDFKASHTLTQKTSYCIPKAILLAALAREQGIPSRIGFADVRNHLSSERFTRLMKTDVYIYHGYTELFLEERWVKVTPAFNKSLCEKFGVFPLEFDGRTDALFHEFDRKGNKHMEYIKDRGTHADVPYHEIREAFMSHYPEMCALAEKGIAGDLESEA